MYGFYACNRDNLGQRFSLTRSHIIWYKLIVGE
jgi:hypothetical protein